MNTPLSRWRAWEVRHGLDPLPPGNRPVFLLATGWRTGSTLVQRLVASSGELLVWGEPYGPAQLVPALTSAAAALDPAWETEPAVCPPLTPRHPRGWIANLYPEAAAFRGALRAALDRFLAEPARARGWRRWGMKAVRLGAADAHFLKWMYPDARFGIVVRNPWSAWRSYRGERWWWRRPGPLVTDAATFGSLWRHLALGFHRFPVPDAVVLRQEDLAAGAVDLCALAEHLGLARIDPRELSRRERGPVRPLGPLPEAEIAAIADAVGEVAAAWGYGPPPPGGGSG